MIMNVNDVYIEALKLQIAYLEETIHTNPEPELRAIRALVDRIHDTRVRPIIGMVMAPQVEK